MSIQAQRRALKARRRERAGKCPQCGDHFAVVHRSDALEALVYVCVRGHKFRRSIPTRDKESPPDAASGVHAEVQAARVARTSSGHVVCQTDMDAREMRVLAEEMANAGQDADVQAGEAPGAPVPVRAPRRVQE